MNARVLVVEDEKELAELISMYLEAEGIVVEVARSGEGALAYFSRDRSVDLLVLDINLPGTDGFEVLSRIRRDSDVPVIIVSARAEDEDHIYGLGLGADEYVTKPFSPKVLVARIRALIRRARSSQAKEVLRFGPFTLDLESYSLKKGDDRIALSAREFEVLACLVQAGGRPLKPEAVYDAVWGNAYGDTSVVGVYIQRLRKKLDDTAEAPAYIETVYGHGYRFCNEALREPA